MLDQGRPSGHRSLRTLAVSARAVGRSRRRSEEIGERSSAPVLAADHEATTSSLGGTSEQLREEQATAANDSELRALALVGRNFTQSFPRFFEGPRREDTSALTARIEKIKCANRENGPLDGGAGRSSTMCSVRAPGPTPEKRGLPVLGVDFPGMPLLPPKRPSDNEAEAVIRGHFARSRMAVHTCANALGSN